jgi:hypothetical protein
MNATDGQVKATWETLAKYFTILTAVLSLYILAGRMLAISQGDATVIRAIVRYVEPTKLVLVTTIPLLSFLALSMLAVAITLLFQGKKPGPALVCISVAVPTLWITYWAGIFIAVVILFALFKKENQKFVLYTLAIASVLLISLWMFLFRNWLTVEAITREADPVRNAVVLSEAQDHIVVLYDGTRKIDRIPTRTITERKVCVPPKSEIASWPLLTFLLKTPASTFTDTDRTADC